MLPKTLLVVPLVSPSTPISRQTLVRILVHGREIFVLPHVPCGAPCGPPCGETRFGSARETYRAQSVNSCKYGVSLLTRIILVAAALRVRI